MLASLLPISPPRFARSRRAIHQAGTFRRMRSRAGCCVDRHAVHSADGRGGAILALDIGGKTLGDAAWSYPDPTRASAMLRDHVACYAGPFDMCSVDGERVRSQPGGFYGEWITADLAGPFKAYRAVWDGERTVPTGRPGWREAPPAHAMNAGEMAPRPFSISTGRATAKSARPYPPASHRPFSCASATDRFVALRSGADVTIRDSICHSAVPDTATRIRSNLPCFRTLRLREFDSSSLPSACQPAAMR